jgi:RNA polymerase sigma factor (sigma-70 family)
MKAVRKFPDAEIVSNLRDRDLIEETIRSLYRDHYLRLSRYILVNSGSEQDAEDIFQEVIVAFIELVRKDRFRGESTIGTFLYSMNRHAWLNELKRRGRADHREKNYEKGRGTIETDASDAISQREESSAVAALVASLSEVCRKILTMYYYDNLSMKEILAATNYENEQVVRNKKYKCLKQLEQMLDEQPQLKQTLKNFLHG